tara:strand:+ start:1252 stop:3261 length:2010 start_codon:yes stop_codon:yes gene_type:complete
MSNPEILNTIQKLKNNSFTRYLMKEYCATGASERAPDVIGLQEYVSESTGPALELLARNSLLNYSVVATSKSGEEGSAIAVWDAGAADETLARYRSEIQVELDEGDRDIGVCYAVKGRALSFTVIRGTYTGDELATYNLVLNLHAPNPSDAAEGGWWKNKDEKEIRKLTTSGLPDFLVKMLSSGKEDGFKMNSEEFLEGWLQWALRGDKEDKEDKAPPYILALRRWANFCEDRVVLLGDLNDASSLYSKKKKGDFKLKAVGEEEDTTLFKADDADINTCCTFAKDKNTRLPGDVVKFSPQYVDWEGGADGGGKLQLAPGLEALKMNASELVELVHTPNKINEMYDKNGLELYNNAKLDQQHIAKNKYSDHLFVVRKCGTMTFMSANVSFALQNEKFHKASWPSESLLVRDVRKQEEMHAPFEVDIISRVGLLVPLFLESVLRQINEEGASAFENNSWRVPPEEKQMKVNLDFEREILLPCIVMIASRHVYLNQKRTPPSSVTLESIQKGQDKALSGLLGHYNAQRLHTYYSEKVPRKLGLEKHTTEKIIRLAIKVSRDPVKHDARYTVDAYKNWWLLGFKLLPFFRSETGKREDARMIPSLREDALMISSADGKKLRTIQPHRQMWSKGPPRQEQDASLREDDALMISSADVKKPRTIKQEQQGGCVIV